LLIYLEQRKRSVKSNDWYRNFGRGNRRS
jgi:hypothetical protein